jgi:hypothetical protein
MVEVVELANARLDVKARHRDAGLPKPLALHRKFSNADRSARFLNHLHPVPCCE